MAGLREKIKGVIEKVDPDTFHYVPGNICRLNPPGDEMAAEARERLQEIKKESPKEDLCARCLENSDGRKKINVKGFESCPWCGTPNSNYKGDQK